MRFGSFEPNSEPQWIAYVSDVDRRGQSRDASGNG
jgi:hypothetical protein